jgi:DNA modification methylase
MATSKLKKAHMSSLLNDDTVSVESYACPYSFRSPKRVSDKSSRRTFPYYAGYSEAFADDVLSHFASPGSVVLDPWNGSGTTTFCSEKLENTSFGFDLNPVMCVVARARIAKKKDIDSARKLWASIRISLDSNKKNQPTSDPLSPWLSVRASSIIRNIIDATLKKDAVSYTDNINEVSNIVEKVKVSQAVLLVSIFLATKKILNIKNGSNPTWSKKPSLRRRHTLSIDAINSAINSELDQVELLQIGHRSKNRSIPTILCANSEQMPLKDESIDLILTSPPYCTRIDYAISTLFELAILGLSVGSVESLRRSLLGTTAIRNCSLSSPDLWGKECKDILDFIKNHPSHGSKSYYHKNTLEYFSSLFKSISEMARVLQPGGIAAVVLQSSYYKERKIDLPKIFSEMAFANGLNLLTISKYQSKISMARLNTSSARYRKHEIDSEDLLILSKPST